MNLRAGEELPRLARVAESAAREHLREHAAAAELPLECLERLDRDRRDFEAHRRIGVLRHRLRAYAAPATERPGAACSARRSPRARRAGVAAWDAPVAGVLSARPWSPRAGSVELPSAAASRDQKPPASRCSARSRAAPTA